MTPKLISEKPLLSFAFGVHTPLVYSHNWHVHLMYNVKKLSLFESFMLGVYISTLNALLEGILKLENINKFKEYDDLLTYELPPEKYSSETIHRYVKFINFFRRRK